MKANNSIKTSQAALAGLVLLTGTPALAYDFALGSTGADGPLNVTTNTVVPLPADGVLNYTTVNIDAGATLSFSYGSFHPGVALLATGDVTINGTIDVSGADGTTTGAGEPGPGGGRGGNGQQNPSSSGYRGHEVDWGGSVLDYRPLGGDGGRGILVINSCTTGSPGGGGGGGALMIVSNTAIRSSAAAVIDASGGTAGSTGSLSGCSVSSAPQDGDSGHVILMAPTVDAQTLSIASASSRVSTFDLMGTPSASSGTLDFRQDLVPLPSPLPTALITHIDGAAVTPTAVHVLPAVTSPVTATVLVTGCTGNDVTAQVYPHSVSYPQSERSASLGSAATGSDSIDVDLSMSQIDGLVYVLLSRAVCAVP